MIIRYLNDTEQSAMFEYVRFLSLVHLAEMGFTSFLNSGLVLSVRFQSYLLLTIILTAHLLPIRNGFFGSEFDGANLSQLCGEWKREIIRTNMILKKRQKNSSFTRPPLHDWYPRMLIDKDPSLWIMSNLSQLCCEWEREREIMWNSHFNLCFRCSL